MSASSPAAAAAGEVGESRGNTDEDAAELGLDDEINDVTRCWGKESTK